MDKDYWRLKKREQRAKKGNKKPETVFTHGTDAEEKIPVAPVVHAEQMVACPVGVEPREWVYACERAARAKKYAAMFPNHVRPSEERFQDPLWQWENEVRGRFGGKVGGVSDNQLA